MLRERFVNDEEHPCHDQESADALDAVETVTYVPPAEIKKDERRLARIRQDLEDARRKAHAADLDELVAKQPKFAPQVKLLAKRAAEKPAMAAVEKRLTCEGLLNTPKGAKHQAGIYDDAMRLAVRRFQQKHMIYEANFLRRKTVEALSRSLLDNDYDAFVRAFRERVVDGAQILEDGSAGKSRNLVDEYTRRRLSSWACRTRRRFWPSSSGTPARTISGGSGWRSSCRRAPTTTGPRWTCRSSSTAATSGTTCRSTTRGTTSRSPARSTRR